MNDMNLDIFLTVNGETVAQRVEPRQTLVDFLKACLPFAEIQDACEATHDHHENCGVPKLQTPAQGVDHGSTYP